MPPQYLFNLVMMYHCNSQDLTKKKLTTLGTSKKGNVTRRISYPSDGEWEAKQQMARQEATITPGLEGQKKDHMVDLELWQPSSARGTQQRQKMSARS